jgi:hypothetical protein
LALRLPTPSRTCGVAGTNGRMGAPERTCRRSAPAGYFLKQSDGERRMGIRRGVGEQGAGAPRRHQGVVGERPRMQARPFEGKAPRVRGALFLPAAHPTQKPCGSYPRHRKSRRRGNTHATDGLRLPGGALPARRTRLVDEARLDTPPLPLLRLRRRPSDPAPPREAEAGSRPPPRGRSRFPTLLKRRVPPPVTVTSPRPTSRRLGCARAAASHRCMLAPCGRISANAKTAGSASAPASAATGASKASP